MSKRSLLLIALLGSVAALGSSAGTAMADGASCPAEQLTQPFLPWGDSSQYALAPNGDFESGLDGWSVSGGAGLVADPEPWMVTDGAESSSLELPQGSSATTAPICIDLQDATLKLFAVNNGDPGSNLLVSVSFTTLLGLQLTLPIDEIDSSSAWAPTPSVWILVNLLALNSTMPVQFTFTPLGAGDWEIDDLYVDPWGRT